MQIYLFTLITVIVILGICGYVLFKSYKQNQLFFSACIILFIFFIDGLAFVSMGEQKLKSPETIYNEELMRIIYMDESRGLQVEETIEGDIGLEFVNENGIKTSLLLFRKKDSYEVVYSVEPSRIEVYEVTARYTIWGGIIWEEKPEEFYKVYINREYVVDKVAEN